LLLYGTRRVVKTVIIQQIAEQYANEFILLNGEDLDDVEKLMKRTTANYKNLVGNKKLVLIDEAQNIPEIGKY